MAESINIDGVEYPLDTLSAEARAQLDMIVATDRKIQELQIELAIAQTARNAYGQMLSAKLPKAVTGFSVG